MDNSPQPKPVQPKRAPSRKDGRRYESVQIAVTGGGVAVHLDGCAAKTPGGRPLVLPTAALAELLAEEWRVQPATPAWSAMLATRLACGALDADGKRMNGWREAIARLAETDLLCYLAGSPRELAVRQQAVWTPVRGRVEALWDVCFATGEGVAPMTQAPEVREAARAWAAGLEPFALVAADWAARLFGSAILAAALAEGMIDAEIGFAAATLDETFQQQIWGVDCEAAARRESLSAEARLIGRFLAALRPS